MDGDVMARERDHLKPHVRVLTSARAQIRVPVDEPQRVGEIVAALETLAAQLRATSQMGDMSTRALAMQACVQECERKMQRIARGRWQEPMPKERW